MKINVLTLSWNGLSFLEKLRDGLFRNLDNTGMPYEWYIRSNGCIDGTPDEASKWENTKVLAKNHNRDSFSKGVNSLFDFAKPDESDLLLLLNNDIVFRDDASLKNMLNLMIYTNAAVCGSRMMFPNSNKISHIGVIFSPMKGDMPWHLKLGEEMTKSDKKDRYFQAVTAACCFVRSDSFVEVGKLSEKLFWAFEDIDMCLNLSLIQGYKVV